MEVVGLGEGPEDLPSAGHVRVDYEIYAHGLSEELALLHVLGSADPRYGLLAAQILGEFADRHVELVQVGGGNEELVVLYAYALEDLYLHRVRADRLYIEALLDLGDQLFALIYDSDVVFPAQKGLGYRDAELSGADDCCFHELPPKSILQYTPAAARLNSPALEKEGEI